MTCEIITAAQALERYDMTAAGSCIDHQYAMDGDRESIEAALQYNEADTQIRVTTGLMGWADYTDFCTVLADGGNHSFFARRK